MLKILDYDQGHADLATVTLLLSSIFLFVMTATSVVFLE